MTLTITDLSFSYGSRRILHDVGLEVGAGQFAALLGPNGSGKSTLVKAVAGVHRPDGGSVAVDGTEVTTLGRRALARTVGYVPQAGDAPFDLTVAEAVMLGRTPHFGFSPRRRDHAAVAAAIARMGLEDLATRNMSELSGGQAQRALIARALAQDTRVLLLDEPTSALDLRYQVETLQLVREITRENGITALIAIHDLNQAAQYCDRIVLLHAGRKVADGPPAEALDAAVLREVYEVDVEVRRTGDAVEVRPRTDGAGRTLTGERLRAATASSAVTGHPGPGADTTAEDADADADRPRVGVTP